MRNLFPRVAIFASVLGAAGLTALVLPADAMAQSPGSRAWLGIAMDVDAQMTGVRVGHVVRGSPADKAGCRAPPSHAVRTWFTR